jgi:hypothetical protein
MYSTRGPLFHDTSEIKWHLLLLNESIGHNIGRSRAFLGGMVSMDNVCISGVVVTWGTPVLFSVLVHDIVHYEGTDLWLNFCEKLTCTTIILTPSCVFFNIQMICIMLLWNLQHVGEFHYNWTPSEVSLNMSYGTFLYRRKALCIILKSVCIHLLMLMKKTVVAKVLASEMSK